MKIIIIGGGNIGSNIAVPLIRENHDLVIIEQNPEIIHRIENELDALIINGDGAGIDSLKRAGINNSNLLIAASDDDRVNVLSSILAKKLNPSIRTLVKIKNCSNYFDNDKINISEFNFDQIINPNQLVIDKIVSLIEIPEAVDIIDFCDDKVRMIALIIYPEFELINKTLIEISTENNIFQKIRITGIYRNEKLIIPKGNEKLQLYDRIYCIGKPSDIDSLLKLYFNKNKKIKNVVISPEPKILPDMVKAIQKTGCNITIIEPDREKAEKYSEIFDNVLVINGYSTDTSILNEIKRKQSCYLALTDNDEYNIISSATAKSHGIDKTICSIRNIALTPILTSFSLIDATFSNNVLTIGEILKFSRRGNINSVTYFSEIGAEAIEITILDKISILEKKLSEVDIPNGMIIAAIIRNKSIIIPTGNDCLLFNDRVIVFVLPSSLKEVDVFFSSNLIIGR